MQIFGGLGQEPHTEFLSEPNQHPRDAFRVRRLCLHQNVFILSEQHWVDGKRFHASVLEDLLRVESSFNQPKITPGAGHVLFSRRALPATLSIRPRVLDQHRSAAPRADKADHQVSTLSLDLEFALLGSQS